MWLPHILHQDDSCTFKRWISLVEGLGCLQTRNEANGLLVPLSGDVDSQGIVKITAFFQEIVPFITLLFHVPSELQSIVPNGVLMLPNHCSKPWESIQVHSLISQVFKTHCDNIGVPTFIIILCSSVADNCLNCVMAQIKRYSEFH